MSQDAIIAALARLEAGQAALRGDLSRLEAGQAALRDDLSRLKSGLGALGNELAATRSALMDRIDRAQHSVDLLRDDIVVNYGAADRTQRIAKGASDETRALADEVRAMQRQIAKLRTDMDQRHGGSP